MGKSVSVYGWILCWVDFVGIFGIVDDKIGDIWCWLEFCNGIYLIIVKLEWDKLIVILRKRCVDVDLKDCVSFIILLFYFLMILVNWFYI